MKLILHIFIAALHGDQQVRNKLKDLLESMEVGWASDSVETIGERYVKQLSSALWYLDPQHGKFHSRSINLPSEFSEFQGFNDRS